MILHELLKKHMVVPQAIRDEMKLKIDVLEQMTGDPPEKIFKRSWYRINGRSPSPTANSPSEPSSPEVETRSMGTSPVRFSQLEPAQSRNKSTSKKRSILEMVCGQEASQADEELQQNISADQEAKERTPDK